MRLAPDWRAQFTQPKPSVADWVQQAVAELHAAYAPGHGGVTNPAWSSTSVSAGGPLTLKMLHKAILLEKQEFGL